MISCGADWSVGPQNPIIRFHFWGGDILLTRLPVACGFKIDDADDVIEIAPLCRPAAHFGKRLTFHVILQTNTTGFS